MCDKILFFLANLYPFNKKITRSTFLKLNFLFTIVIVIIFFSNLNPSFELSIAYITIILWSPVGIYQYLSEENPLYGIGNTFVCIAELFIILSAIFIFLI